MTDPRVMPEKIGCDQHADKAYHVEPNGRAVTLANRPSAVARNGMQIQYLTPAAARRLAALLVSTADELD